MNNLFEGLSAGDLKRLVRDEIHIDRYTSKMGLDKDVITVSFKITDRNPAEDLVKFIETGYDFVLDADISSGEKSDGDYLVFVEIPRTEQFPEQIMSILYGITRLTDIDQWDFKYKKEPKKYPVSKITLSDKIPLTSSAFEQIANENVMLEHMKTIARVPKTGSWDFYTSVKKFKE